ncbi:hypothetical protein R1flu_024674 [Riccia fluitans]|uniref:Uncharacterized protein ycf33 n=1 Tax=Riccia fluitans TaxID=41844 RepID=A0ABD1XVJ6_9MARC
MQATSALPLVACLGAAASLPSNRGTASKRPEISHGASIIRPTKRLWQQSISSSCRLGGSCRNSVAVRARKDAEIQETGKTVDHRTAAEGELKILEMEENVELSGPLFLDVEQLVQGQVGRIALVTTLLLGVGTLAVCGSADAATVHLRDGLHSALDTDLRALALGPEGPLLEEFWDNMRRYGLYFLTVASGGIYSLVKPLVDALRNPLTAILVIVVVTGTVYLVGLT